jgi:hypothetical protein
MALIHDAVNNKTVYGGDAEVRRVGTDEVALGATEAEAVTASTSIGLTEIAKPTTPASTKLRLYVKAVSSATEVFTLDSAGVEDNLTARLKGPGSAVVDHAIVRWDGTTGRLVQGVTGATLDDTGHLAVAGAVVGAAGGDTGQVALYGTTSGVVTLKVADAAGTWAMTLPTGDGLPNQFLKTDGSGGCSWDDLPSSYIAQDFTTETEVVVAHALGAYPIVQVIDSNKKVFLPQDVEHTSVDSLTVTFSETTSGTVLVTLGAVGQTLSKSFMISSPTADAHSPLWRVPVSIIIQHIHVLCIGGTNIVGQLWEYDANGANGATVDADITAPAGTSTDDDGAISNPNIAAGNYLGWKTTSVSGTPTRVIVTFEYTEG